MSITREFNLFLNAGAASPLVINVNQYDQGEVWNFTLYSEKGIQYTPSTGAIVGIKSDNLGIINTGTVVDGKVVINETEQMTAAPGKAIFELMIDDSTHGTANFIVLVEPKPGNNADLSESDLSLIQQAIDSTNPEAIAQGVSDWMDDNLAPEEWVIDSSLSVSGAAADAKAAGDLIRKATKIYDGAGAEADVQELERLELSTSDVGDLSGLKVISSFGNATPSKFFVDGNELMEYVIGDTSELEGTIIDEIGQLKNQSGLTEDIKQALLACFRELGYKDDDGRTAYDNLYNALYAVTAISLNTNSVSMTSIGATQQLTATTVPEGGAVTWSSSDTSIATVDQTGLITSVGYGSATITAASGNLSATCSVVVATATVTTINATYTQTGAVFASDSLDSLKSDLVVTASWSDSTTTTVASENYTLSGTLTEGTSTITVSYAGKTTTFTVTVSAKPKTYYFAPADNIVSNAYINDSGESATLSGAYYIDEFMEGFAQGCLNSSLANFSGTKRAAFYGSDKAFVARAYGTGAILANESSYYIKPGWSGTYPNYVLVVGRMDMPLTGKHIDTSNGELIDDANSKYTDYVEIDSSATRGVLSATGIAGSGDSTNVLRVAFYDSGNTFISSVNTRANGNSYLFDIPSNAKYFRASATNAMVCGFPVMVGL